MAKPFINGSGELDYRKGHGAGSEVDPFVPEFLESNSGGVVSALASILAKLADPATQTTLAAVLAKLDDPATQTTLAAVLAKLDDPATQTTLAAVQSALEGTLAVSSATLSSVLQVSGTASSSSQTLIAAPGAGNQIALRFVQIQNESETETVALLKRGASDTDPYRVKAYLGGGGASDHLPPHDPWLVGEDTAVVLDLSPATDVGYVLRYTVESV